MHNQPEEELHIHIVSSGSELIFRRPGDLALPGLSCVRLVLSYFIVSSFILRRMK